MPIHNFAVETGEIDKDVFDTMLVSYATDFRADVQQRYTLVAQHAPDSPDVVLARKLADEIVNVSGAEVNVFVRTDNADFDSVWDEDPDPTYWNRFSVKGYFRPAPLETELTKWGIDMRNRTEVVFSHHQIFNLLGDRMLRQGDVIQLPYGAATPAIAPKNYRIENATPSGVFRYIWLYLTCAAELLTADITVRPPGDVMPEEEPLKTGGVYRESL